MFRTCIRGLGFVMREGKIKNGKAWGGTQRYYSIISFGKHRVDILGTMLGGFLSG